jgi:phosphatidylglycerol:prolipoprotein diacylglycerol transferase
MPWGDVAAPSLAAGLMFTRIGCYLFGCDFGKPLSGAAPEWLRKLGTFPHWPEGTLAHGAGSPAWVQHVQHRGLGPDTAASFPVHPTQIYESLVGGSLLLLCLFVRRHQKFRGQVFLVFTFGYGVLRFLLEMIRDDLERGEYGPHLAEQIMVPGGLLLFAIAYIWAIAPSVEDPIMRRMTQVVSLVPVLTAYLVLRPASFGDENLVQLSTSQWVAILTALPAAAAYAIFWNGAQIHPESAMSLGLEDFVPPEGSHEAAEPTRAAEATPRKGEAIDAAPIEPIAPPPASAEHETEAAGKEPA